MATTVVAMFDDRATAEAAAQDLVDAGFLLDDISLVSPADVPAPETPSAVETGITVGGVAGLLAGLVALAIPGVGPVLAAGPIAAVIAAGAGLVGAAAGGLIGALVDFGISEEQASQYAEGVRRGGTIVAVRTDQPERAEAILRRHRPVDLAERSARWRQEEAA